MGPMPAQSMKELDEFIERFDPEKSSFSVSNPRQSLEDEELFESALELAAHEYGEPPDDRLGELIARLDEEHGEEAVRSAIVDYYGHE